MKRMCGIGAVMMLMVTAGCEMSSLFQDKDDKKLSFLEFKEDKDLDFAISKEGGVVQFEFDAYGKWKTEVDADWVSISPANGNGSSKIELTIDPSTERYERYGHITVTAGDFEEFIQVRQLGTEGFLEFSEDTETAPVVSCDGATFFVSFETTENVEAQAEAGWISVSTEEGAESSRIQVTVAPNYAPYPRVQNVVMTRGKFCKIITVKQLSQNPVPGNKIYYTSSDGRTITPYPYEYVGVNRPRPDVFGAEIISNEYTDGYGVITFDGPVTLVGEYAFYNCETLTDIVLPDCVTAIGKKAFTNTRLKSFIFPEKISEIGFSFGDSQISCVYVPNGITEIPASLFSNSKNLKGVILPDSITSIGAYAFQGSSIVTSDLPDGLTIIDDCLFFESNLKLKHLVIPEGVTEIGRYAFSRTELERVTIPETVNKIGDGAFSPIDKLEKVFVKSTTPPTLGKDVFWSSNIFVPVEAVETYRNAEGWKEYHIYSCYF